MKTSCIESNCDACCRRYWITVLPKELKKESEFLKLGQKQFIEKYCILHLNLFPIQMPSGFSVPSVFLPKKIALKLKKKLGGLPDFFVALPGIAFKRSAKGECIFLSKKLCKIYAVRPRQCKLFPFISMEKKSLKELYPFCKSLKAGKPKVFLEKAQKANISAYFSSVAKNGFQKTWVVLPKKAVLCLENNSLGKIPKKDFLKITSLF